MPTQSGLALLTLQLDDLKGQAVNRNFMYFEINATSKLPKTEVITVAAKDFSKATFSGKQWDVLDGLKINGTGNGSFEYTFPVAASTDINAVKESYFLIELSAKELFVKDRSKNDQTGDMDFMLGAIAAPSSNPNSYPMTDEKLFPSKVVISVDGQPALTTTLADDPADHRGVLSWHHQLKDRKLREAGSYGYLVKVPVTKNQLKAAAQKGQLVVQIKTEGEGGIAVYGKSFGRYPLDPSLVMKLK
jgi:predicted transcriptional regulator